MKNKYFVLVLLIIYFYLIDYYVFHKDYLAYIEHLTSGYKERSMIKLTFYMFSLFLSVSLMAFIILIKQRIVFLLLSSIGIITYIINLIYKFINGRDFGFNDLQIVFLESDKMSINALLSFKESIINSFIFIIPSIFGLYLLRKFIHKNKLYFSNLLIIPMVIVSISSSFIIYYKTAGTSNQFSIPISTINNFLYYSASKIYYGEREELTLKPSKSSTIKNIILIVDESVNGHYLSINGYKKETTPYLSSIKNKYINFGLISSGANGSAPSNMILMSGIQLENLPDKDFTAIKKYNIFQYAKNADYMTSYISGQMGGASKLYDKI